MGRLIDADTLNMHLADIQLANRGWKDDFCDTLDDIMQMVDDMPTVDAVPVVRCKDCIGKVHWYKDDYGCTVCGLSGFLGIEENDFCSCGERRGEDG